MEYRKIRYTVRTRIERNEWTLSIHPAGIEGATRVVTGPRVRAESLARSMIDRWHERTAAKRGGRKEARARMRRAETLSLIGDRTFVAFASRPPVPTFEDVPPDRAHVPLAAKHRD
jgi:hypothetical protein